LYIKPDGAFCLSRPNLTFLLLAGGFAVNHLYFCDRRCYLPRGAYYNEDAAGRGVEILFLPIFMDGGRRQRVARGWDFPLAWQFVFSVIFISSSRLAPVSSC